MNQLPRNITSLEVAEMVGREHPKVMRDIRNIIDHLGGQAKIGQSYFIESTYTNSQNKEQPCFLLTKKGCELYATRMTGEKGTQFAFKYVERFNEMEEHIQQEQPKSLTAREQLLLIMQANEETAQRVDAIEGKVEELHNTMRIDGNQEKQIQDRAKAKIVNELGGKETNAYKEISGKVFRAFWKEFKDYFEIPRYGELPKSRFAEAIKFIEMWQASTTTRMEIDACNQQMDMNFQ